MHIRAIAIIGQTNSGKTPLGQALAQEASLPTQRIAHLDFGEHLRLLAAGQIDTQLTQEEYAVVHSVMNGSLLEDSAFSIVRKVIEWFLRRNNLREERDMLALNGVPRHVGQARDLDRMGVDVILVAYLACSPETARQRKRASESGAGFENRSERNDGSDEILERKIRSFQSDTIPILAFYQERTTSVVEIPVRVDASPKEMLEQLRPHIPAAA